MFDLRYHVASLAAVFVALIVGILVGVGLSGSGVTNKVDLRVAQDKQADAERDRDAALAQVSQLKETQKAFELAYPALMTNLLAGKRIGVLFVGSVDGGINNTINRTLEDAGADAVTRTISLSVPVDAQSVSNALFNKGPQFVKYVGNDKLQDLGNALGSEFATGGQTPLWKTLGKQLVGERNGNLRQPIDGLVVVRTAKPQQGDTAQFLDGFYDGVAGAGVPAVGVENTDTKPSESAVDTFHDHGLSSVDDLDLTTGRAALALLLAGAAQGKYGTADGADAILPKLAGG